MTFARYLLIAMLFTACGTAPQVPEDVLLRCAKIRNEALEARLEWATMFQREFVDRKEEILAHVTAPPTSYGNLAQMIEKDRALIIDLGELMVESTTMFAKSREEVSACQPVFDILHDQF